MPNRILRALVSGALFLFGPLASGAPVLVDGQWLESQMENPLVVIIDVNTDAAQYDRFHIPGAVRLPYGVLLKPRKKDRIPVRLSDQELTGLLGQVGVTGKHHVVVYDDLGGLDAARLFWELERIGHPAVSVLDGGLVSWVLEGRKVVNTPVSRKSTNYSIDSPGRGNEATLADLEAGKLASTVLIDARSREEYVGDLKKQQGGHIPGALWWEWSESVDVASGFRMHQPQILIAQLGKRGIGKDKTTPIIAYCQSGHRAAQTYLTLRRLGYENVKLYSNSMNEFAHYRKTELQRGVEQ